MSFNFEGLKDAPSHETSIGPGMSMSERGMSRELSRAVSRGETATERKATWPFDYYQITNIYPVDYKYWWTPYQMDTGDTQLVMMHAVAYAEDGNEFGADQILRREFIAEAHRLAIRDYMLKQREDTSVSFRPVNDADEKKKKGWC